MKFCPFCGSGLQDDMYFCPKCGRKYKDAIVNSEAPVEQERIVVEEPSIVTVETIEKETVAVETTAVPKRKKKKRRGLGIVFVLLLLATVVGGIYFVTIGASEVNASGKVKAVDVTVAAQSVLYLEVFDDANNITSTASGFVIDDGLTLVTNYHVIEDAHHIVAWTPDGNTSVSISTILAYDEKADLAVLKCDSEIGVQPLVLADSDTVKQGDAVYAAGYPLGLAHTLSDGVISSRYLDENGVDVLQTTAAISSGSSGGALFNEDGHVIGVTSASYVDGQNLNLAIASNILKELMSKDYSCLTLAEYYQSVPHPYSLDYILENRKQIDGKEVLVEAYISSVVVFELDGERWVDYIIVSDSDSVLGYMAYGYSEEFFEDADYQKYVSEFENGRVEEYKAIGIEVSNPEEIYQPGEIIKISGVIENVEYVNEEHAINWHHLVFRDFEIVI